MADDDADEALRQREIAEACLGAGDDPDGRLGLYRRLIQGNLRAVALRLLPRTRAALDGTDGSAFALWFARFLAEAGPHTPYLRDVPVEFVAWALPLWQEAPDVARFVPDVARYEIDRVKLEAAPKSPEPGPVGEVTLTGRLVFAAPHTLERYDFAVDGIDPEPAQRTTWLFLHRDADNAVHATRVSELSAAVLGHALAGAPFGEAVLEACPTPSGEPRAEVARTLADLAEAGALLGGQS
jgi:hypothetical protein